MTHALAARDDFERPDASSLGQAVEGGTWIDGSDGTAALEVSSGTAVVTGTPTSRAVGSLDLGIEDVFVEAAIVPNALAGSGIGVFACGDVAGNSAVVLQRFEFLGVTGWQIVKALSGATTFLAQVTHAAIPEPAAPYVLRLEVRGGVAEAFVNGDRVLAAVDVSGAIGATEVGIIANDEVDGSESWDDFEAEAIGLRNLATADELRSFLDLEVADLSDDRADLLLKLASGEVRAYTGRAFDRRRAETFRLDGKGHRVLVVPEVPVTDVTSITENPDGSYGADPVVLRGPDDDSPQWEWTKHGTIRRIDGGRFVRRARYYDVVADHGFRRTPDEVKAVVLRVAGRPATNPDGIRQETIGRYSYTIAGEASGVGLFAADMRSLDPYKIETKGREGSS